MASHSVPRRPIWAGVRSAVVPGWGQVVTGRPVSGSLLIGASLGLAVGTIAALVVIGPTEVMARLATPGALGVLLAVNAGAALVRLGTTNDAWRAAGGRSVVITVLLAAVVLLPHAAIGYLGWQARSTMIEVFAAAPAPVPPMPSSPPSGTPATTTTAPVPTTTTVPPTTSTSAATTTTTTTPPTTTTTLPLGTNRLTVLLLGGDAGPGRPGLRTDTMIVATVDTVTGQAAMFGLPRNFGGITFDDGTPFPADSLLNEVYGFGRAHPDLFPGQDSGAVAVVEVAERITGLEIDHWALVDLTGFADVVDAFGGVTMDIPTSVDGPRYDPSTGGYEMIRIQAGEGRTLDGAEALAYSRARYGTSDYSRMGRQRCVLAAMVDQANPLTLISRLPGLLEVVESNVSTDIPLDLLPDLIRLVDRVDAGSIAMIGFDRSWRSGWTEGGLAVPDIDRIRTAVFQTIVDPSLAAEQSGVLSADASC